MSPRRSHPCALTSASAAPVTMPPGLGSLPGAADGAVTASWGSGVAAAPTFPRPDWWGEHGCRHAGVDGHVCVDVFGRPVVDGGSPCVAEARAAMADLFETYRAVAG